MSINHSAGSSSSSPPTSPSIKYLAENGVLLDGAATKRKAVNLICWSIWTRRAHHACIMHWDILASKQASTVGDWSWNSTRDRSRETLGCDVWWQSAGWECKEGSCISLREATLWEKIRTSVQVAERPPIQTPKKRKRKEKKPDLDLDLDLLGWHACNSIGGAVSTKGIFFGRVHFFDRYKYYIECIWLWEKCIGVHILILLLPLLPATA